MEMLHEREKMRIERLLDTERKNIRTRNSFLNIYYITNKWNKKINK